MIELVSKREICWVLWSLVVFDLVDDPTGPEIMLCGFLPNFVFFSLIIVKSLQLRRSRKIARPHKYYPVHVIFFLWPTFSLFCFSQVWEFCVNFPTLALALAFILNYS